MTSFRPKILRVNDKNFNSFFFGELRDELPFWYFFGLLERKDIKERSDINKKCFEEGIACWHLVCVWYSLEFPWNTYPR